MSWWVDFFDDLDSLDTARASAWYADDIELRAGNGPVLHGKTAATDALAQICTRLSGLKHEVENVVVSGDEAFIECPVTYHFKSGQTFTVPAAAYIRRAGGSIKVLHVYQHLPSID